MNENDPIWFERSVYEHHVKMVQLEQELYRVQAELDRCRKALHMVEFIVDNENGDHCPWCENSPERGHKPNCLRQLALGSKK